MHASSKQKQACIACIRKKKKELEWHNTYRRIALASSRSCGRRRGVRHAQTDHIIIIIAIAVVVVAAVGAGRGSAAIGEREIRI